MKAHTIKENGGQSVPIPKTDMTSILTKQKAAKEPDWEGYGNPPKGSNKGDITSK